jgi:hypothetical protein
VKHEGDICMIIELGNIHAKWKLFIESSCMLLANGNVTVWIGTWFGVCRHVTNKRETNYMQGTGVVKLIVTGNGVRWSGSSWLGVGQRPGRRPRYSGGSQRVRHQ